METVSQAIIYAVDHHAQIINISLSDTRDIPQMRQAVQYAESHGSLIVASAGNRLTSTSTKDGARYPAAYGEVVGVTGKDADAALLVCSPGSKGGMSDTLDVVVPLLRHVYIQLAES